MGRFLPAYDTIIVSANEKNPPNITEADSNTLQIETRQRHPEYPCLRPDPDLVADVSAYSRRLRQ